MATKKTDRPLVLIHDVETGEITERPMDDTEFAQYQLDQVNAAAQAAASAERQAAKQALLDKLGITADDARLLLS